MADYILSGCSTADLSAEHFAARDIHYICFHFLLDGRQYEDDLGKSIAFEDFYKAMTDGADTKTSQINTEEYIAYFTPFLDAGKDIIHITLSSGISGANGAACMAAERLRPKYPDRKIHIVDSLGASSGYGLFLDRLADLRDSGLSIDELYKWAIANRLKLHHWFFSTDLTHFRRGGRISASSAFFGNMLNICPLMNVNSQGKLVPREKIRGKKRVMGQMLRQMELHAQEGLAYKGRCFICHSDCASDARELAAMVEQAFPSLDGPVEIFPIGTVIGSHTGPGTVALFFWGDERTL